MTDCPNPKSDPKALDKSSQDPLKRQGKDTMAKTSERGRDAGTGRFIPVKEAEKRKDTAVVEKIKVGPTKHRKK